MVLDRCLKLKQYSQKRMVSTVGVRHGEYTVLEQNSEGRWTVLQRDVVRCRVILFLLVSSLVLASKVLHKTQIGIFR